MTSDEKSKKSNIRRPIVGLHSCSYTTKHVTVCLSMLLLLSPARGQPGSNETSPQDYPYQYSQKFSPSMAVMIVVLIAALFFIGFFSIYIRRCSERTPGSGVGGLGASLRLRVASRGLDAEVMETFPTFEYSVVKGLKIGKGALECAVCLNEFEDDESLRLIPKCDHVFHTECVDAWLASHTTCPVCRANLVPQPGENLQVPELNPGPDDSAETQNPQSDDVSIRVLEDPAQTLPSQALDRSQSVKQNRPPRSRSVRSKLLGKFPRSHSTGHSLVQPGENTDRFTLRLPEDVRKQVMSRALNRTTSCMVALPREGSSRRSYRTGVGEGSSRGWRSFRRPERLDEVVKSDRWVFSMAPPFFSRASSVRSPKVMAADGECSMSTTTPKGAKTPVKLPSFKCLDPKGGDSADSTRPPV